MITSEIFENPQILIAGRHDKMIQNILDYEYLCGLKTTSLMGIINPFGTSSRSSYFFGSQNIFLQQFRNLKQAKEFSNAKILINALSERSAAATSLEALELDFNFIYIMAEGIPERQSLEMAFLAREKKSLILGPASVGMLLPGKLRLGLIGGPADNLAANNLFQPGGVNLITRSGGLFNELCASIYRSEIGLYSGAAIGGDRFIGSTFLDYIKLWDGDKNVKMHLLLGEVGGDLEYAVAESLKAGQITKPVLVHFIGASAEVLPTFLQFGHAGAKANNDRETVKAKIQFFKECGEGRS